MEAAQTLLQTPLGSVLSAAEAAELAQASKTRTTARGQFLARAGDSGDALYIILNGGLEVVLGTPTTGETVVASIGPGQIAGELEVMTNALRVASLRATDDTTLLELPAAQLDSMLKDNRAGATKLVTLIAKTLARRLAAVNQRIVSRGAAPKAAPLPQPSPVGESPAAPAPPPTPTPTPRATATAAAGEGTDEPLDENDLEVLDKLWG